MNDPKNTMSKTPGEESVSLSEGSLKSFRCSTPTAHSDDEESPLFRRNSNGSQLSSKTTATTTNYCDSGHFSSTNISECLPASLPSPGDDFVVASNSAVDFASYHNRLLRERDQSLFLALQDVRKLRSELERLGKSEKWYKNELQTQKHSRMEMLEKFYSNERKSMQENQRLQKECIRLYTRCGELEKTLQEEREHVEKERRVLTIDTKSNYANNESDLRFELNQQRALICDLEKLNNVLRKQKRLLLDEQKHAATEKGEMVFGLQKKLAQLEEENRKITSRCVQVVKEKNYLKQQLMDKDTELTGAKNEIENLQLTSEQLKLELVNQVTMSGEKEQEIASLQHDLDQRHLHSYSNELQSLRTKHNIENSQKTDEINLLHKKFATLQQEVILLEQFRLQSDKQQREIESLLSTIQERDVEVENLKRFDAKKTEDIKCLRQLITEYQNDAEKSTTLEQKLKSSSQNSELIELRQAKAELDSLSAKYSSMCSLCERTKFELDMRNISLGKLQFEKQADQKEILELRRKTAEYLQRCETLRSQIDNLKQCFTTTDRERRRDLQTKDEQLASLRAENLTSKMEVKGLGLKLCDCTLEIGKKGSSISTLERIICDKDDELLKIIAEKTSCLEVIEKLQIKVKELSNLAANQNQLKEFTLENAYQLTLTDLDDATRSQNQVFEDNLQRTNEKPLKSSNEDHQHAILVEENTQKVNNDDPEQKSKPVHVSAEENDEKDLSLSNAETRIQFIRKLLAQQTAKVMQLSTEQEEWEQLLKILNEAQRRVERTTNELQIKSTEFNAVNDLLHRQNEQFSHLQIAHRLDQDNRRKEVDELKQTFQMQLNVIRDRLSETESKLDDSQQHAKRLTEKNEHLTQEYFEDMSRQRETSKRDCQMLAEKIAKLTDEKELLLERMKGFGNEAITTKQSTGITNTQVAQEGLPLSLVCIENSQNAESSAQLRILANVLDSEHRRKMSRYDVHIRTLLSNVKTLKKALASAEHRIAILLEDKSKTAIEQNEFQSSKLQLSEMQRKFELSQEGVKTLKHQLETACKQFETCDVGKSPESVVGVSNLMDDYKKLIQQSRTRTTRLTTSAILDLIDRSNSCAPSLTNLSSTVDGLRGDIQQLIAVYPTSPTCKTSQQFLIPQRLSLMDELKAADLKTYD